MYTCQLCQKMFKSINGLMHHISMIHHITSQNYYDLYYKQPNEELCPICGNKKSYINFSHGYQQTCSATCHSKLLWSIMTPAQKQHCLNKKSKSLKDYWQTMTAYEKQQRSEISSIAQKDRWSQISINDYTNFCQSVSNAMQLMSIDAKQSYIQKGYTTKIKNGTVNSSSSEKLFYTYLKQHFDIDDIECNYKDSRYPWHCDFYIRSLDIFIELNLHWTHGEHWFNERSKEDQLILATWQEKAKCSLYYAQAIDTWTRRDVEKYNYAIHNRLNYVVFFKKQELNNFMDGGYDISWMQRNLKSSS